MPSHFKIILTGLPFEKAKLINGLNGMIDSVNHINYKNVIFEIYPCLQSIDPSLINDLTALCVIVRNQNVSKYELEKMVIEMSKNFIKIVVITDDANCKQFNQHKFKSTAQLFWVFDYVFNFDHLKSLKESLLDVLFECVTGKDTKPPDLIPIYMFTDINTFSCYKNEFVRTIKDK